jgi:hypothetical protein
MSAGKVPANSRSGTMETLIFPNLLLSRRRPREVCPAGNGALGSNILGVQNREPSQIVSSESG